MTNNTRETRTARIMFRATPTEKAALQRAADQDGRSLGQLVRWRLFGRQKAER